MKRWRPLIWLLVSLACFIAAFYFWRLGDKWEAEKPATPKPAAAAPKAPTLDEIAAKLPKLESVSVTTKSTAPVVNLNPPATNAVTARSTNAFPFRLSNTEETIGQLSHNSRAILLENALIDAGKSTALAIPESLRSHGDPGSYIVQSVGPITPMFRSQVKAAG